MNNISEIEVGDIFSEISHYTVIRITPKNVELGHHESGHSLFFTHHYVENLLSSADQYQSEVDVTKEDGKPDADGNIKEGIRTIWDKIGKSEVFSVCYQKQDVPLSNKKIKELQQAQIITAVEEIEQTAKNKKGVIAKAAEVIAKIQQNPILPFTQGEDRVLRGFKASHNSITGLYDCIDMDIKDDGKGSNLRKVNITTIKYLVYKGIKYTVKTK